MRNDLLLAGLGGQGTLLAGRVLAQAAIEADMAVTWYPSYSPEVRGGTVECTIVVADEQVGSPVIGRPHNAVFIAASMFEDNYQRAAEGGTVMVNIPADEFQQLQIERDDLRLVPVDATARARGIGSERVANMIMLGAYVQHALPELMSELAPALEALLPERHRKYMPINREAFNAGAEIGKKV